MDAAHFYTGIVVDAYAKLKSVHFDSTRYAGFVVGAGQPALEIGCGDGEPLLSLLQAGLDVDGVDSSADMLDRCRAHADALNLQVHLYHQRMEDLRLPRRYRAIYLAGPTFNLLPDDDTAQRGLDAIRRHLKPDGLALIPQWTPPPTPGSELGVRREVVDEEGTMLAYTPVRETYDRERRTRITAVQYERRSPDGSVERAERRWILHWHSLTCLREMCEAAGLRIARVENEVGQESAIDADEFTIVVQPV